jgi:hypothetical protein
MDATISYLAAARAYADGVRVLFAPSGVPTGERGGRGPASPADLAEQAEKLSPLSADLTEAAVAQLADADPAVRTQAATGLLAKALTDLEISTYLLQAARDEEDEIAWAGGRGTERGVAGLGATEDRLKLLLGEAEAGPEQAERGEVAPPDIPTARVELSNAIKDTLVLISERAGKTGQEALGGLVGLGIAEVAQAAGVVGMDIAQALGQAEKVTRLYNAFRDFALKAYDSLVALLGQPVLQAATSRVLEWVDELKRGKLFSEMLEKLYETGQTRQDLSQLVTNSQAGLGKFAIAIKDVDGLGTAYEQQIKLADKLLRGLRFLGGLPAAVLPQGRVLLAAAYIVLGAYVVLAGADYVDARRVKLLNRVPGVHQVVETNLVSA